MNHKPIDGHDFSKNNSWFGDYKSQNSLLHNLILGTQKYHVIYLFNEMLAFMQFHGYT